MQFTLFFLYPLISHAYGILCNDLDGQACTHYQSCSWMNGRCQRNNCLQYNSSNTCDKQNDCHWVNWDDDCQYCVMNCNDSTDCFHKPAVCRFGIYCKLTLARKRLGCAVMDTPSPSTYNPSNSPTPSPSTYNPSNSPSQEPTTYPFYHDPYGERFKTEKPTTKRPTAALTKVPTKYPSRVPSKLPTFHITHIPSTSPSNTPSKKPTNGPSVRATNTPSFYPSRIPTNNPSKMPSISPSKNNSNASTFGPLPYPTYIPTAMPKNSTGVWTNDDTTLQDVVGGGTSGVRNVNTTATSDDDSTNSLLIILPIVSSMVIFAAILAALVTKKRRRTQSGLHPALSIEIPITPISDVVNWPPTGGFNECTPQIMKRRCHTYPSNNMDRSSPSPKRRRRLHSAISLGELSSGGEDYGQEVDLITSF